MPQSASMKSVGIWIRVSTEDQAQGESPAHHEKRARLYAEAKGWDVITVYDLSGVSGKTVMEHPEAKRMLRDIGVGTISDPIRRKVDRHHGHTALARSYGQRHPPRQLHALPRAREVCGQET